MEGLHRESRSMSERLNSITSALDLDFFTCKEDSTESPEDPTLPELPSRFPSTVNKKRSRDEYLASSSDAPLFSSDDLAAASAENYYEPRVKRQHRRPWFEIDGSGDPMSAPSSPKKRRTRRSFKRTYDSGVWLSSDEGMEDEEEEEANDRQDAIRRTLKVMENGGSIYDEDELGDEGEKTLDEKRLDVGDTVHQSTLTLEEKLQQALVNRALQITEDPGGFEGPVFPYWQKQPGHLMGYHVVQEYAQRKVMLCVEEGGEVVDLSYVGPSGRIAHGAWQPNAVQAALMSPC